MPSHGLYLTCRWEKYLVCISNYSHYILYSVTKFVLSNHKNPDLEWWLFVQECMTLSSSVTCAKSTTSFQAVGPRPPPPHHTPSLPLIHPFDPNKAEDYIGTLIGILFGPIHDQCRMLCSTCNHWNLEILYTLAYKDDILHFFLLYVNILWTSQQEAISFRKVQYIYKESPGCVRQIIRYSEVFLFIVVSQEKLQ